MILGVLPARMSSTRLPGKVLKPLAGQLMVLRQIQRLRRTRRLDALVVDTPNGYAFVSAIYDGLYAARPNFKSAEIRALVQAPSELVHVGGHRRP